jgi:hypothetical protein
VFSNMKPRILFDSVNTTLLVNKFLLFILCKQPVNSFCLCYIKGRNLFTVNKNDLFTNEAVLTKSKHTGFLKVYIYHY